MLPAQQHASTQTQHAPSTLVEVYFSLRPLYSIQWGYLAGSSSRVRMAGRPACQGQDHRQPVGMGTDTAKAGALVTALAGTTHLSGRSSRVVMECSRPVGACPFAVLGQLYNA